ncbi:bifunctional diguanylate cyclase/phosphodiesterase [Dechloromonas sp. XY25]|uniref:Bifunctional diguanylate cyclase/phosphodiesterase n=1 Tax=Dechloromonas hankyongensis TaxID=2908002 RepID=A0ABS9K605_9RHOO|nr:bifunctional diguanylate cyclase/phosphodiesterase [Dechloromonas hankyongensis]MCG2578510.1 bifunctional diguanylate cyclase/phosphodiesterase [Dechloromonas hankyongensis]
MRIRNFIFGASIVVSVLFFGGSYLLLDRIFGEVLRANAEQTSEAAAKVTFAAMYQLMSQGWSRSQADAFVHSTAEAGTNGLSVQIYRSQRVSELFGNINQPPLDDELQQAMRSGDVRKLDNDHVARHIYPLIAEERCLRCHINVRAGDVLGAVEVRQDFTGLLADARRQLLTAFAPLLPAALIVAALAVWWVGRRIEGAVERLQADFEQVQAVDDLRRIAVADHDLGFVEFNRILGALGGVLARLRTVAVDKDILSFEIGLLERFVITSEVVRDWREYVGRLLIDINSVLPAHTLFSLFKIDDEMFDLEVFWYGPVSGETKAKMEHYIRDELASLPSFPDVGSCNIHHHVANQDGHPITLSDAEVALRVKSFFVDKPKIGGIVGIGVHAGVLDDETRYLVVESVLSTLLNVVGSVKAIYKYTRDLEYYATRDPLTDLFNQRVFWELSAYEVGRAQRHGYRFGLLLIDVDNFKLVNDNYGHAVGDTYLQRFARQVQGALRDGDIFARYGGDEFVAVLPEASQEAVVTVAERVRKAIEELEVLTPDGVRLRVTASIGIAIYPDHAENPKDLLLFADNMMYRAKAAGKDQVAVPTKDDIVDVFRDITQKSVMVLDAIEHRRVVPYFQPILDVANRRIVAYEVLSRIELDGQIIRADEFVEIAERIGVIHRLDMLVLEQALATLAERGHEGEIFVNLSPRALVFSEFSRDLRRIVAASGISPDHIVFEITERDTVKNLSLLERFLSELKADGFKLAIDDFGSGFSSFHYLRRFPIDYLKIEGDFISNMLHNEKDHTFVTSIRSLAREMGITVVAEYVESAEVLGELERMEVHLAQGYYIGRPARELLPVVWQPPA